MTDTPNDMTDFSSGTCRTKLFDLTALQNAKAEFDRRFRLDGVIPQAAFSSTSVRIALSSIATVELYLVGEHGVDVRGIHFDYGLAGDAFHPVLRFMYADYSAKGDLKLFPDHYKVVNDVLEPLDQTDAAVLTGEYARRLLIDRLADGVFTPFNDKGPKPDPEAEWFPYADNVNKLINDNSSGRYLVVSCITERLTYDAMKMVPTEVAEMRHVLALHMADGSQDLLQDFGEQTPGFRNLALDLGFLCPPRCKK